MKKIKEHQPNFQPYFDKSSDLMATAGPDGHFSMVNPACTKLLGWTADELCSQPMTYFVHPDDVETLRNSFEMAADEASQNIHEQRWRCRDGSYVLLQWDIQPVGDVFYGIAHEITEQTAALADSQALLDQTARTARFGGWKLDLTTSAVEWTGALFKIFGLPEGIPVSLEDAINFSHPEDRHIVAAAVQNAIDSHMPFDVVVRAHTSKGKPLHIRTVGTPVIVDGKATKLWGSLQDITQQVEQTQKSADIQALLDLTARTARFGGWKLDVETNTVEWTGALYEIFDIPEGAPVSLEGAINFCHPDDRPILAAAVQNAIDNGTPYDLVAREHTSKGKPLHIRTIGTPVIVDGKTTKLWGSLQDITQQVEQTATLADTQALLDLTARTARFGGWKLDVETNTVEWTGALYEIFDIPEGAPVSLEGAINFYHPDDRPILAAAVQNAIDNGTPYDLVARAHTSKGKPLHIRAIGKPEAVDGKATKLWGSRQDITDQVNQLAALADSQALLDLTARTARFGGWELDLTTNTVEWTGALYEIFDTPEGAPVPLEDAINFYHPEDRHRITEAVQNAIDNHTPFDLVVRAHTSMGKPLHVRAIGKPEAVDGKTTKLWGSLQDITEQFEHDQKLRSAFTGTVGALGRVVDIGDPYTASHQREVSHLATTIAKELGLLDHRIDGVRFGALIHDIGKVAMPAQILVKPGRLTPLEYEMVKTHSQMGYDILSDVEYPWPVAEIVLQHHERLDGSGYPNGLKGNEIILEAQIVCVADVVEAMTARRPYREGLGIEVALDEITKNRGTLYNADVVDICVRLFREENFNFTYE